LRKCPLFSRNFNIFRLIFALFPKKGRKYPQAGISRLPARGPFVASVAQANKTARIIWAVLAHGMEYMPTVKEK
jgi:hypothetical protein